jgi:hypothetical protein
MNKLLLTTTKNEVNQPATYADNWYGPRPIQHFRKFLQSNCVQYGPQLKMLKNGNNVMLNQNPNPCRGPVGSKYGNVISFSGGAGIRSATTNLSKKYYSDTVGYLRSRGQSYNSNIDIHKSADIQYATSTGPIWPDDSQSSSSFYATNTPITCPAKLSVYKPSNVKFSSQGAVSSSALILKRSVDAQNMPHLSAYEKKKKLKLPPQPFWGTLG